MVRHGILLRTATPVSHGDTHTSLATGGANATLFMRQTVILDGAPTPVPHISENALRSVLWRVPLADHLVDALDLTGALPVAVANLLYAGGRMGGETRAPDHMAVGHQVTDLYPSLDLLGGSVDAFMLPRSKLRLAAWILGAAHADSLAAIGAPDSVVAESRRVSLHDLLDEETRTRGTGNEAQGNQMLYTYEVLAAGAGVWLELTLPDHTRPETIGALARGLAQWDGYVGGQGRQGRGRMVVEHSTLPDPSAYDAHVCQHGDRMAAGLRDGAFGTGRTLCKG